MTEEELVQEVAAAFALVTGHSPGEPAEPTIAERYLWTQATGQSAQYWLGILARSTVGRGRG